MESHLPNAEGRETGLRARFALPAWVLWVAVFAWMGVIFYLSSQSRFAILDRVWRPDLLSVAAHFVEYAVLAVLLWLALRSIPVLAGRASLLAFMLAVLYAISDEWHQSFVPGRYADVRDVVVDALGALAALLVLRWLSRRSAARKRARQGASSGLAQRKA